MHARWSLRNACARTTEPSATHLLNCCSCLEYPQFGCRLDCMPSTSSTAQKPGQRRQQVNVRCRKASSVDRTRRRGRSQREETAATNKAAVLSTRCLRRDRQVLQRREPPLQIRTGNTIVVRCGGKAWGLACHWPHIFPFDPCGQRTLEALGSFVFFPVARDFGAPTAYGFESVVWIRCRDWANHMSRCHRELALNKMRESPLVWLPRFMCVGVTTSPWSPTSK